MKMSNKLYDVLKWITLIVIPALATAYVGLSNVWGFPYADEVARTACVICTLLGALLGISTAEYRHDHVMVDFTADFDDEAGNDSDNN